MWEKRVCGRLWKDRGYGWSVCGSLFWRKVGIWEKEGIVFRRKEFGKGRWTMWLDLDFKRFTIPTKQTNTSPQTSIPKYFSTTKNSPHPENTHSSILKPTHPQTPHPPQLQCPYADQSPLWSCPYKWLRSSHHTDSTTSRRWRHGGWIWCRLPHPEVHSILCTRWARLGFWGVGVFWCGEI